ASGNVLMTLARDLRDADHGALAFSPDGKLLFSLGGQGILRGEEVPSGKEVLQRQLPRDNAAYIAVSADGQYLAIASGMNTHKLFLWKWQREEPRQLEVPHYGAHGISFSPDGKLLAALGYAGEHGLRVWDVASRRLLYQRETPAEEYHYAGRPIFTP